MYSNILIQASSPQIPGQGVRLANHPSRSRLRPKNRNSLENRGSVPRSTHHQDQIVYNIPHPLLMSPEAHVFFGRLSKRELSLPGTYASPPPGYITPSWPSLYAASEEAVYLYEPSTIWKFTLYWTLLLEGIVFMGCGLLASFTFWRSRERNLNANEDGKTPHKPSRRGSMQPTGRRKSAGGSAHAPEEWIPLNRARRASSVITTIHHPPKHLDRTRRPVATLFLTPMLFFAIFSLSAVISGSLVGWAIAALYNAAFIRMSTWVPALWSAGLTLIVIMSSYSDILTVL